MKYNFLLLGIYRPGCKAVPSIFLHEMIVMLEKVCVLQSPIFVFTDFTEHVADGTNTNTVCFLQLLESCDCV